MSLCQFIEAIKPWQPLIGSILAIAAALLATLFAWKNVGRQIQHAGNLEKQRRSRKQMSVRAVLPLALSAISDYAQGIAQALHGLLEQCVGGSLPVHIKVVVGNFPSTPIDTIRNLAEFIEYSDDLDINLFENLLARIQILSARVRDLAADIDDPDHGQTILARWIETNIIQTASIYAGVAQAYGYARRRTEDLPNDVTWDNVRHALRSMRLYDDIVPTVFKIIDERSEQSSGPDLG